MNINVGIKQKKLKFSTSLFLPRRHHDERMMNKVRIKIMIHIHCCNTSYYHYNIFITRGVACQHEEVFCRVKFFIYSTLLLYTRERIIKRFSYWGNMINIKMCVINKLYICIWDYTISLSASFFRGIKYHKKTRFLRIL